jgi:uncharacterized membrane protein
MEQNAAPRLDLILRPHRSLGRRGFFWVMALLCAASFVAGAVFIAVGAWPVVGFLGLDVLLVWIAFKASYAGARARERVTLFDDRLEIERVDAWGRRQTQRLEPYWLSVDHGRHVALRSHGKATVVGAFLTVEARAELAQTLDAALRRWRQSPSTSRIE